MAGASREVAHEGDGGEVVAGSSHSTRVKFITLYLCILGLLSGIWGRGVCCIAGRTSPNTGVFPTLLQRGGRYWMVEYTRKISIICTDGKTIQTKRITQWLNLYYFRKHLYNSSDPFIGIQQGYKTVRLGNRHPNRSGSGSVQLYRIRPSE